MGQIDKIQKQLVKQAAGLLTGKPIWIWWISYTVLVGLLFVIFYFAWTLITEKWWVIAIVIPSVGIVWGTILYFNQKPLSAISPSDK
jgi:CHASE2 domain-containing sensor protein